MGQLTETAINQDARACVVALLVVMPVRAAGQWAGTVQVGSPRLGGLGDVDDQAVGVVGEHPARRRHAGVEDGPRKLTLMASL